MKFSKKMAGLALCAMLGGISCIPANAESRCIHDYEYVGRGYVGSHHQTENCTHCFICVSCSDDVVYDTYEDYYKCSKCGESLPSPSTYDVERERACNCSNSACCY